MPLTQTLIGKLQGQLTGKVLQAGNSGYDQSLVIDNGRINLRPGAVAMCADAQDVATAYKFAIENKVPFTVRGGGHSAAGYCLNQGGLVINLGNMTGKRLDSTKGICWAQTGNRWRDIYIYLQNSNTGFIPVGGGCPTVGIPGFMLGGGLSFVSRSYGLSVDNLVSIEIVTPDGELRKISEESSSQEDRDLWWACRGGGGGNFGIAVAFELKVQKPLTETMLVGQIRYPAELAQEVYGFYNEWIKTVPNELAVYGFMGKVPLPAHPDTKVNSIGLTPIYNGDPREGMELIAPILKFPNISVNLYNMTLPDFEIFNGQLTNVEQKQAYIRSGFMAEGAFTEPAITTLTEAMASAPSPDSLLVWTHMGGKIEDVAAKDTAFWHREARFLWEVKSIWTNADQMLQNVRWGYDLGEAMEKHDVGAYVNYIDPLLSNWKKEYYGDNLERLTQTKKQWDPESHFSFQQSVDSDFEPTPGDFSPLSRTFLD